MLIHIYDDINNIAKQIKLKVSLVEDTLVSSKDTPHYNGVMVKYYPAQYAVQGSDWLCPSVSQSACREKINTLEYFKHQSTRKYKNVCRS